jgi:P27 family predicted phage terminase small subunit
MAGRRPKPTALRQLNGNAGKRPLPENEPMPPLITDVQPPDWLAEDAAIFWGELSPMLSGGRVLTEFDRPALAALCAVFGLWLRSYKQIRRGGDFYESETEDGARIIRPHPAVSQEAERWKRFRLMLFEFGMTPAARSRVAKAGDEAEADDPVARWLSQ